MNGASRRVLPWIGVVYGPVSVPIFERAVTEQILGRPFDQQAGRSAPRLARAPLEARLVRGNVNQLAPGIVEPCGNGHSPERLRLHPVVRCQGFVQPQVQYGQRLRGVEGEGGQEEERET